MYTIQILKDASRDLARIEKASGRHIVQRIRWLAENIDLIKPTPLKGELSGLFKLREGNYRIIYEVIKKERVIIIHAIGHRKDIYKKY